MLKCAYEVLELLVMVQSHSPRTIFDSGYLLTPDPYSHIAQVIPRTVNWHVKERRNNPNRGEIDCVKLFGIISRLDE